MNTTPQAVKNLTGRPFDAAHTGLLADDRAPSHLAVEGPTLTTCRSPSNATNRGYRLLAVTASHPNRRDGTSIRASVEKVVIRDPSCQAAAS